MPVLNEAGRVQKALEKLQRFRGERAELIVVDGGSVDGTAKQSEGLCDQLIQSSAGRATQMNAGAQAASGQILIFHHVDSDLPDSALDQIADKLDPGTYAWGRFDVRLSGQRAVFRMIEWFMNRRSCLTGVATGDQSLFVLRDHFESLGGFPDIPLMEDIALSKQLKKITRPACICDPVVTSSRRWEDNGVLHTILLMWFLRLAYVLDVPPARLRDWYYGASVKTGTGA